MTRAALLLLAAYGTARAIDLRNASIQPAPNLSGPEKKAVEMLIIEVRTRTGIDLSRTDPQTAAVVISVRHFTGSGASEGFHLRTQGNTVEIQGNDQRGTLYGVGRMLRELRWGRGRLEIADGLDIVSAPKYALRGHQIGYRPKVNTYDAWTPDVFEQYVRDLVVFGTNAIELIPPRSDDRDDSPHFLLSKIEMMTQMSRIISEYGLQVWIWFPAMDKDYTNSQTVEFALKEWGDVFRRLPHIDAVFVPGGDPGSTPPGPLMNLLEKEAAVLRRTHPKAQMWMSPQGFDRPQFQEFVQLVGKQPAWLDGIVYGPWLSVPVAELRAQIPARYPIRLYPDITHSFLCEYPVPDWDTAFAATEGRESINPRPVDEAAIFRLNVPNNLGFITYSEGVNDDANKILWSSLGWNPDADIRGVLGEYARYFINPDFENDFVNGLMSLEQDWRGPLLTNAMVDVTLMRFRAMEKSATPQMLRNWRFLQALYRAYYDAYVRKRLLHESSLEEQAMDRLRDAPRIGSSSAIEGARNILQEAVDKPVAQALRTRIFSLAEALYQTIGMQLSVDLYRAVHFGRGANLDMVDFPLNSRVWLENQMAAYLQMPAEKDRLKAIDALVNRTNPGPGGFYDDLGKPGAQPHLVRQGPGYALDPALFHSVYTQFRSEGTGNQAETPIEWWDYAGARQDTPLTMHYDNLNPKASYKVRVVYVGFTSAPKCKLVANDTIEVHPFLSRPATIAPLEFAIPIEATHSGSLTLKWSLEPGSAGFAAYVSVAEVMLIRK